MAWRARSASDKTDDWPFWYVTDDKPADSNKTLDCMDALFGCRPVGLPFFSRKTAEALALAMPAPPPTSQETPLTP